MAKVLRVSLLMVVVLAAVLALAACTPGANPLALHHAPGHDLPGFWMGLWHGLIIWVTFIWSLFDHSVSIYEVHNGGWPYQLGFTIGAAVLHGGGAHASRRRRAVATSAPTVEIAVKVEPPPSTPV